MHVRNDVTDAMLKFEIRRTDSEGKPISPPLLQMVDETTGERWHLTRGEALRLRDFIDQM